MPLERQFRNGKICKRKKNQPVICPKRGLTPAQTGGNPSVILWPLLAQFTALISCLVYHSTLKMMAIFSSEMLLFIIIIIIIIILFAKFVNKETFQISYPINIFSQRPQFYTKISFFIVEFVWTAEFLSPNMKWNVVLRFYAHVNVDSQNYSIQLV
jgi:hypothetical protein